MRFLVWCVEQRENETDTPWVCGTASLGYSEKSFWYASSFEYRKVLKQLFCFLIEIHRLGNSGGQMGHAEVPS